MTDRCDRVDATPAREAVQRWLDAGFTAETVASAAGVAHTVPARLVAGLPQVHVDTSRAILAVTRRMLERDRAAVPSGPVREHLRALLAAGATYQSISRAAGGAVSAAGLRLILTEHKRVLRSGAEAILAVTVEQATGARQRRPIGPARLRLRQLQARGWSLRYLAERLGQPSNVPSPLRFGSRTYVSVDVDDAVTALWEELRYRLGPSERAATEARRAGFYPAEVYDREGNLRMGLLSRLAADPATYPPSAYDDDGVLHLEWVRGDDALEAQRERRAQVAERRREVHRLTAEGLSVAEIAQRLECTTDVVHADRRRDAPAVPVVERLPDTPAEREAVILGLLEQGCTLTAVAKALKVSVRTVQRYVRAVS